MIVCTQQKWFIREHTLPCDVPGLHIWERCPSLLFPANAGRAKLPRAIIRPRTVSGLLRSHTTWVNPLASLSWKVPQLPALPYKGMFTLQWADSPPHHPPALHAGIRVVQSPSDLPHWAPIQSLSTHCWLEIQYALHLFAVQEDEPREIHFGDGHICLLQHQS